MADRSPTGKAYVVGAGMTKFERPGSRTNADGSSWDYPEMARESGTKALADAGVSYREAQEAYVGSGYGESTPGQRAIDESGMAGIPVVDANNNCSTGAIALHLAARAIRGGLADCVSALGFAKMNPGSLRSMYDDREQPMANPPAMTTDSTSSFDGSCRNIIGNDMDVQRVSSMISALRTSPPIVAYLATRECASTIETDGPWSIADRLSN